MSVGFSITGLAAAIPSKGEPQTVNQLLSPSAKKIQGLVSTLTVETEVSLRHDSPEAAHTKLCLVGKNGTNLLKETVEGSYFCLGYCKPRESFVLYSEGEMGAALKVVAMKFIPEANSRIRTFKGFTDRYVAACGTLVTSPDLKYIAFVGHTIGTYDWQLFVLDTTTDKIRLLGKAPSPPPLSADELHVVKNGQGINLRDSKEFWNWNMLFSNQTLEPQICKFVGPDLVQVSYGKDTFAKRASERIIQDFQL